MYNSYLCEKLVRVHQQDLLQEAQRERLLAQLPRRRPRLIYSIAKRFTAFFMSIFFSAKQVEQVARPVTGQL